MTHDRSTLFTNMGISSYPSQSGDSGAPILLQNSTHAEIVGIHKGATCIFDALSEDQSIINVTSTLFCANDHYKLFSAWENVRTALNLQ